MLKILTTKTSKEDTSNLSPKDWCIALGIGLSTGLALCLLLMAYSFDAYRTNKFAKSSTGTDQPLPFAGMLVESKATPLSLHHIPDFVAFYALKLGTPTFHTQLIELEQFITKGSFMPIDVRITFYTGLAIENGGYEEMNAIGGSLEIGSLAAPRDIPFGTTFVIDNLPDDVGTNLFTVDDRGGAITRINAHAIKVDVYVKRQAGESDQDYFRRVNDLGVIYTTALYRMPLSR